MSFESPAALWLLASLPAIVLLWLLRPKRPRVRIPSVLLWPVSLAERQSARPWQRLRNHPLLWLQLLVALLLAIAAARPFVPAEIAEQRLIVLLDASGSMRAHDFAPTRWDAARSAVLDLAKKLGPDQRLSVIRADDLPRVLVADVHDAGRLETILAAEAPSFGPIDAAATVALAAGLAQGGPSEWVLVGDGHFPELPAGVHPPADTRFRFVSVGSAEAGNVALTGLAQRANGATLALQAGVQNASDQRVSGSVQLLAEGRTVVGTSDFSVDPHAEAYVGWDGVAHGPRWFAAQLTSVSPPSANVLVTDDRAWSAAGPTSSSEQRVLLVSSGNTFLERVITVEGSRRIFKVTPADWAALAAQGDGETYALVVLDRQPRDTSPIPRGSALYIGTPDGDEFRPALVAPTPDHLLLRNVDWSEVRIGRARRLPASEAADWETVVGSDGGPLLAVRTVREAGDRVRREAMLTFELGQSDLPLRPAFPVLMANLLDWLSPRPDGQTQLVRPGGVLLLEPSPLARSVRIESVLDAALPPEELAPPWPPRTFRPSVPGLYRLVEEDPRGATVTFVVADGFAPTEADLSPAMPAALMDSPGVADGQLNVNAVRAGVWPWLLAGLLVLAAAEWLVDARGR